MEEMKKGREDWPVWAREMIAGIHLLHQEAQVERRRSDERQEELLRRLDKYARGTQEAVLAILEVGRGLRRDVAAIGRKLEKLDQLDKLDKLDEILRILKRPPGRSGGNGHGAA